MLDEYKCTINDSEFKVPHYDPEAAACEAAELFEREESDYTNEVLTVEVESPDGTTKTVTVECRTERGYYA